MSLCKNNPKLFSIQNLTVFSLHFLQSSFSYRDKYGQKTCYNHHAFMRLKEEKKISTST